MPRHGGASAGRRGPPRGRGSHTWGAEKMSDGVAPTIPSELQQAVLLRSEPMPADSVQVKGHDFSEARCL